MNTPSKTLLTLGLALVSGLSLIQSAQAAPRTYGPRDTVRFERLSDAQAQPCRTVVAHRWNGSAKRREAVEVCAGRDDHTSVKRWVGPRDTIPIYE